MRISIKNYGMNGEGVGSFDGKVVFVPGALTGEEVECEAKIEHKNYTNATLNKIITSSPNRTTPPCPYFDKCGGCDLQHMKYLEQLKFKKHLVENTFKKVGGIDATATDVVASPNEFNYRNKISFSVSNGSVGFKARQSNQIVDVDFCLLADNAINLALKEIKAYISTHPIKSLKNIVIRSLNNQTLIAMVCSKKENLLPLAEHLKQSLKNFGLYLVENPRHDSVVIAGKISFIYGLKNIALTGGIKMSIDVDSFYQTNSQIQTELYNHILNNLNSHDVVVNGYSGAGLLSALAAQKAKKVYGIEINKTSHKNAENLKKVNKIGNLTNILGDFFKNLKNISNFNTVILDPSKKGCGAEVMRAIDGVEKIIYVSCNPIALAKDLKIIKDNYTIVSLTPFDMFPQTISVETCVVLNKNQT